MNDREDELNQILVELLAELFDGATEDAGWILNPGDPGLLRSLERLSAEAASAVPSSGGASIAAHVDHLRYGLELLNRWSEGEEDPFASADYAASWARVRVTEAEWTERLDRLQAERERWATNLSRSRDADAAELKGIVASVAHVAYHLGAIRQIDRRLAGPPASD
jgi:uncharacterized damage-inducible protein DinB